MACTYRMKDAAGAWQTISGKPAMMAALAEGRLDHLLPEGTVAAMNGESSSSEAQQQDEARRSEMDQPDEEASAASLPVRIPSIPLDIATRAFMGTSHSPERRGQAAADGFRSEIESLWQRFEPAYRAAAPERQAAFVDRFNEIADRYAALTRDYLASHGQVMSTMIAGGSKFPVERNRKRSEAADNKARQAAEYMEKAPARLQKALSGPVDNSVNAALEAAKAKLAEREKLQAQMKATNAALRKGDDEALRGLGYSDAQIADLKKPDFAGRTGIPGYMLTNNNAEIRRQRERIAELEQREAAAQTQTESDENVAPGVRMVKNAEAGRLQLFFDGKPEDAVRDDLKAAGFRWAPSSGAWQRQLTGNAELAAQGVIRKHFQGEAAALAAQNANTQDAAAEEAQRVQAAIEGKGLIEAARFLTQSADKAKAAVAGAVLNKLERLQAAGVKLELNIAHRGDMVPAPLHNSRGYTETAFDEKGRDIAVWINGADVAGKVGTDEETLLHELVHAATTGMVFYGKNRPDTLAGQHVRALMAVTDAIAAHISQRFEDADAGKVQLTDFEIDMREGANNAFRSDDEVLAWALSSRDAQTYLEGIPYKSGSLWSRFVSAVRVMLGLSPQQDTALSEVLAVAERLMTDDAPEMGRAAFWHKRGMRMVQQQGQGSIVQTRQDSKAGATAQEPSGITAESLPGIFSKRFPKLSAAVEEMLARGTLGKKGGLVVLDTNDEVEIAREYAERAGHSFDETVQFFESGDGQYINAFFDPVSGLTFLIGPNLTADSAPALVMHEAVHGQRREWVNAKALALIDGRGGETNPMLRAFLDRVAKRMELVDEAGNENEAASYIVELAVKEGRSGSGFSAAEGPMLAWIERNIGKPVADIVRDFVATVRAWALAHGVPLKSVTVDDLVAYAQAGVRKAAQGRVLTVQGDGAQRSMENRGSSGNVAGMADETNVAGKQAPTPAGDDQAGGDKFIAYSSDKADDYLDSVKDEAEESGKRVFFHVSPEKNISSIQDDGGQKADFGGLFALENYTPGQQDHYGKYLHEIKIEEDARIATEDDIRELLESGDYDDLLSGYSDDENDISDLRELVADGMSRFIGDEDAASLLSLDPNDAQWVAQTIRSKVAKDAGFAGLSEEDGTLIFTGDGVSVKLSRVQPDKTAKELNEPSASAGSDVQFSRSGTVRTATRAATDALAATFTAPGKLSWWHKTVGTMYNLAERSPYFAPVFRAAQGFIDDVSHYANDAAEQAPKLLPKLDNWRDIWKSPISAADNKAIAKPIFEGTLMWKRDENGRPVRVADDEADSAGIVWHDSELRSMFGLTDQQIRLYREFRAATNRSVDSMTRADMLRYGGKDAKPVRDAVMDARDLTAATSILRQHFRDLARDDPDRAELLTATIKGIEDRADRGKMLMGKGYAPLSRFGRYTVDVLKDGKREYFGLFETAREANQMAARMRREFGVGSVTQGMLSQEAFKLFAGVTPETLELFGNALGLDSTGDEARDKAFQEYLRLTKSNRSAMKRMIHRQGIAGYSEDVTRVLASFVYSNARQTAAGLNIGDLGEAVQAIPKEQGELKDVAFRLADYVKNPQEEAQAIRGLLFAQYLGGSIASAFVNMTQPAAVTFPWLSQFGGAKAAAAQLAKAAADMAKKRYEPDLARALHLAEEDGTVSPQEVHQLMAQAQGSGALRAGDGTKQGEALALASNGLKRLAFAWGKVFGMAEQVNRRVTFIAAYRTAVERGMDNPEQFARKAVQETQFVYSKASKMQWGRGAIGGTLMTFKTYSVAYLELLHRMATQGGPEGKRAALLALGVLMLMGGVGGLPFAGDAEGVAEALARMLGYNISVKKARQELLEDAFGRGVAGFIDKGITGLPGVPLDVSGRLGMGNLIPGTGLLQPKSSHTSDMLEIVGPAGDLTKRAFEGAGKLLQGDVAGAALQVAPTAVRNAAKGVDMAATGMYRDAKGYKVLDTDGLEAALKAIGFQPKSVAAIQEANAEAQQAKNFYNLRAQEIRAKWAQGVFENDPDKVQEARDEVADWNRKNPDQRMSIAIPSVMKKVQEMRKSKDERIAATAPKAMRASLKEEFAKVREGL